MKPDYMIVYMKDNNSFFRQDYIFGETARNEANRLYKEGFVYVELLKRAVGRRGGFDRVKKVDRRK